MWRKRLFWSAVNLLLLAAIAGVAWVTLLPVIWGPNDDVDAEYPLRRDRNR